MSVFHNNALIGASGQGAAAGAGYEIERSLRFNSADSAYLNRTPSSAGNRKTFTLSCWVKKATLGANQGIFNAGTSSGSGGIVQLYFTSSEQIAIFARDSGGTAAYSYTTSLYRDASAWYHIVLSIDTAQASFADQQKLWVNGVQVTAWDQSQALTQNTDLLVNSTVAHYIGPLTSLGGSLSNYLSSYLCDYYLIDGQALSSTDFGEFDDDNVWQPIEYAGTYGTNGFHLDFSDNSSASALGTDSSGNGNDWTVNNISVGVTSVTNPAWYASSTYYSNVADVLANATNKGSGSWTASSEFVYLVVNSGGNPGSNNVSAGNFPVAWVMYRNTGGTLTRQGSFGGTELPSFDWSDSAGTYTISNSADFYIFSSQDANPPTSGQVSGTIPALTTASFRTLNDINPGDDSLFDSPTNGTQTDTGAGGEVSGNYAVWSPISKYSTAPSPTNGNLTIPADTGYKGTYLATIALPKSGKWYWEVSSPASSWSNIIAGVADEVNQYYPSGGSGNELGVYFYATNLIVGTGNITAASSPTFTIGETGVTYGFAADMDTGNLYLYRATIAQNSGNPIATGLNTVTTPLFPSTNSHTKQQDWNFGQRPFVAGPGTGGAAPSGYKALCTSNLPDPTIADGSTAMDVVLYNANGSTQSITGLNFSPDLVWTKSRNRAYPHGLHDSVRGAYKYLRSNGTNAESDTSGDSGTYTLTSFDSDGFSVGADGGAGVINNNAAGATTYAAWAWDAGASTVANTDGSISSSVRANASAGFSIVSYSGTGSAGTVGHGLNAAPSLIFVKARSGTIMDDWAGYHYSLGNQGLIRLNRDVAVATGNTVWNSTSPTSTVFSLAGERYEVNYSGYTYIAYCWAPVEGYSAFGSYTGNGSSDGPFVYTGFRPRWILIKNYSPGGQNWILHDTTRNEYNVADLQLLPSAANAEYQFAGNAKDILSNGFKLRGTNGGTNASGELYIYAAVAEHPFKYARAR